MLLGRGQRLLLAQIRVVAAAVGVEVGGRLLEDFEREQQCVEGFIGALEDVVARRVLKVEPAVGQQLLA